jgi:cell division protein YceG involved in septum cleavage
MKKIILTFFYILLAGGLTLVILLWAMVLRENVKVSEPVRIYIPTGSDFDALTDTLMRADLLRSRKSFLVTARLKSFGKTVKPGLM